MCGSLSLKHEQSAYHDGVGEVPVGLALQAHGAELRSHVALGRGLVEGGLLDASHLGDHKEGKHTLQGGGGEQRVGRTDVNNELCLRSIVKNNGIKVITF